MKSTNWVKFGEVTLLVNIPGLPFTTNTGFTLLTLRGTILAEIPRKSDHCKDEIEVEVEGRIVEEEQFLIVRVTSAVLPNGFPLTIADLETDIAINTDYIIMILPVIVV
jgi:hypothetical protein